MDKEVFEIHMKHLDSRLLEIKSDITVLQLKLTDKVQQNSTQIVKLNTQKNFLVGIFTFVLSVIGYIKK